MTLPDGWRHARLGEECSIEIGGTPSRNVPAYWDDEKETGNLWVSIRDMNRQTITRTAEHITASGIAHSNVKLQPAGTVLLSFKLTIGRVAFAGLPLYTNEAIAGLQSRTIVHDYLFRGLQQWDLLQGVDQAIKGATLNKAKLKKIEFILPQTKSEQLKIAEILSILDRAIEKTEALIDKQERTKNGLLQDLLTRGIDERGNVRSQETHSFRDSPLGRIPVDWACAPLSKFVPSAQYGVSTSLGDTGQPVLRMNNLCDGEAELSQLKYTDFAVPEGLWLRPGDVLFNRTNSWEHVGRSGIWRGQLERATFASYLVRLNPDVSLLLPELLCTWLNWDATQIRMRQFATPGVQQVNINPTNLRLLLAAFPQSLHEQQTIVEHVATYRKVFQDTRAALKKLLALKSGLMLDLLTGRKRVTASLQAADQLMEQVA